MVVRVGRDGIGVLGNRVAIVTVLEEPVPCAANGGIAEGVEKDIRKIDAWRDGATRESYTTNWRRAAWPRQKTEKCERKQSEQGMGEKYCWDARFVYLYRRGKGTPEAQLTAKQAVVQQKHSRLVGLGGCVGHLSEKKFCGKKTVRVAPRYVVHPQITRPIPIALLCKSFLLLVDVDRSSRERCAIT